VAQSTRSSHALTGRRYGHHDARGRSGLRSHFHDACRFARWRRLPLHPGLDASLSDLFDTRQRHCRLHPLHRLARASAIRLFLTLSSSYYRIIELPEASFGLIAAVFGGLGIVTSPIARWMVAKNSLLKNYALIASTVLISLIGVAFRWNYWGVIFHVAARRGLHGLRVYGFVLHQCHC